MPSVVSSGVVIEYEAYGVGRPAFLLIHGWSCERGSMRSLARLLAPHGRVVNVDLREHGGSGGLGDYDKDDVVGDLAAVVASERLDDVVIVGHSLGAKFALACGQRRAGLASALVLLDTSIVESDERRSRRMAELDESDGRDRRARVEAMFLPSDNAAEREALISAMVAVPPPVGRRALVAGDGIDTAGALRDCRVPVLYVGADQPRESVDVMRALQPKLEYRRLPGVGHFVQVFAAEAVASEIISFVTRAGLGAGDNRLSP